MAISFNFPLGCHCYVSVVFPWKPFWIVLFSSGFLFLFFLQVRLEYPTVKFELLGGKVPWGLCDFQSEQKPRQLPSPHEGGIETKSFGLGGRNRPALAAGDCVHLPQICVSQRYKRKQY